MKVAARSGIRKYATFEVLSAELVGGGNRKLRRAMASAGFRPGEVTFRKTAHRHDFDYQPRPGFLYVRSRAISSRCNDNYDEFPAPEIKKAWRTFIGKPVFVNHRNDKLAHARGFVIDAALHEDTNPDGSPDTWVEVLMEIDAMKYPKLAQAILAKEVERTSMGTDVAYSVCSACGNRATTPLEYCAHIPKMKGKMFRRVTASGRVEDVLIREICYGLGFFENSLLVEDPADPTAYTFGVDDRGLAMTASKATAKRSGWKPLPHLAFQPPSANERDEKWDEEKHPRDDAGKFAPKTTRPRQRPNHPHPQPSGWQPQPEQSDASAQPDAQSNEPQPEADTGAEADTGDTDGEHAYTPTMPPEGSGTKEDPIRTDDVEAAAQALSEGKHVELQQPKTVSTLLDKLSSMVKQAAESGGKINIDLCNVTAKGTNLFCVESKGISRAQMPQLKVKQVQPGSRAAKELQPNEDGEYDLQPMFREHLMEMGYKTTTVDALASHLKASQNELNGAKCSGMMKAIQSGKSLGEEPIFVSNDDYIVDGHHRWAATVAADWEDADPTGMTMPVDLVDMSIIELLAEANHFAEEWGAPQASAYASRRRDCGCRTAARSDWGPKEWGYYQEGFAIGQQTASTGGHLSEEVKKRMGKHGDFAAGVREGLDSITRSASLEDEVKGWSPEMLMSEIAKARQQVDEALASRGPRSGPAFVDSPNGPGPYLTALLAEKRRRMQERNRNAKLGFGEVKAPVQVDTLREEACPVCGEKDAYDGVECQVCGFARPPDEFADPDLEKAKEIDLRQQSDEEGVAASTDLECPACGARFKSDGTSEPPKPNKEAAQSDPKPPEAFSLPKRKEDEDPDAAPDDEQDPETAPKAGDTCPECGEGTLQEVASEPKPEGEQRDGVPVKPTSAPTQGVEDNRPDQDAQAPPDDKDGKPEGESKPDDEKASGDDKDDEDEDDGDDNKPPWLKKKPKKETAHMKPTLAMLREQQIMLAANRRAMEVIAEAAGISPQVRALYQQADQRIVALRRQADEANPANPIPDPPSEAPPAGTTEEARAPAGTDDPTTQGAGPVTDVAPDAATSVTNTGGPVLDPPLDLNESNVQAPVAGTEGPRPESETRTETEIRTGDPSETGPAWPLEPFMSQAQAATATPEQIAWAAQQAESARQAARAKAAREGTGAKAPSSPTQSRTIAALTLARLRIQAGIAKVADDLSLATQIEGDPTMTDERITDEIATLNQVVQQAVRRQPTRTTASRAPAMAGGVMRTTPSLAPTAPPGLQTEAVGFDLKPGEEEFLFE